MPVGLIAAGVGAAGSIAGAAISSSATKKASDAATQAAAANNALQTQIYTQNRDLIQPTVQAGDTARNAELALLGLNGDPAAADRAFADFRGSSGYTFRLNQGINAITGNAATRGMLDSGSTLKALDAFGQGTADQSFSDYITRLDTLSNRGVNAIGSLTGTGQAYAGAVSNNNNSAAGAVGNAALTGASNINAILGNFVSGIGLNRGQSSYGKTSTQAPAVNAMTFDVPRSGPAIQPSPTVF